MFKRLTITALAAVIFAASGTAALFATPAPASADQDDHHPRHVNRPANPYGANGYWSNGSWHNRPAYNNNGRHVGWNNKPPKHHKHHKHDRDDRR